MMIFNEMINDDIQVFQWRWNVSLTTEHSDGDEIRR